MLFDYLKNVVSALTNDSQIPDQEVSESIEPVSSLSMMKGKISVNERPTDEYLFDNMQIRSKNTND